MRGQGNWARGRWLGALLLWMDLIVMGARAPGSWVGDPGYSCLGLKLGASTEESDFEIAYFATPQTRWVWAKPRGSCFLSSPLTKG